MSFDIAKDGTISNIEVKQGSGIPSLDRSAERAVRNSNPLPPLPADYRGSSVSVSFYFEYSR
jgi:protein TonB